MAALLLMADAGQSQKVLKVYTGPDVLPDFPTWFGSYPSLASIEDLDGDGLREILVGEPIYDGVGGPDGTDYGRVTVLSSGSGSDIYEVLGSPGGSLVLDYGLGNDVAALGDVNGDGIGDFAATSEGSYPAEETWVWSGADGSALAHFPQAASVVAPLGDLNSDGLQDFAIGKPAGILGGGSVTVYLGGSFTEHFTVTPDTYHGWYGAAVVGLGDVSGDGVPDLAVGAPGEPPYDCVPGWVGIYSGADGRLLGEINGTTGADEFGKALVAPGDLTGDGVGDLVVASSIVPPIACGPGLGALHFIDAKTGTQFGLFQAELTGISRILAAVGDLDGNGYGDVLVRTGKFGEDVVVSAIDGRTQTLIYEVSNAQPLFAVALADIADWDGDDFPDFVVATPWTFFFSGKIQLFSGAPIGVSTFGTACPTASGSLPRIGATGVPYIGTNYSLHLSRVSPGLAAFLAIGLSNTVWRGMPLPLDLGSVGMPGCQLLVGPAKIIATQTTQVTPGLGAATIEIPIPNQPALIGFSGYAQWFVANPPGSPSPGAVTRGLKFTLQAPPP